MINLRIKLKQNLKLNRDINYTAIRNIYIKQFSDSSLERDLNKGIIFELIHKHSNYESLMWDFWRQEKSTCIKEITNLLYEISKLDIMLTWDCNNVLTYYIDTYERRNKKSFFVIDDHKQDDNFVDIEIPDEFIQLSSKPNNLVMGAEDVIKLESFIKKFKTEFKHLIKSSNNRIKQNTDCRNLYGDF